MTAPGSKKSNQAAPAKADTGPDWWSVLREAFDEERQRSWAQALEYRRPDESKLALLFGHVFGGHMDYQHAAVAQNLLARCQGDHEGALVLCILASWQPECTLRVEVEHGLEPDEKEKRLVPLVRRHLSSEVDRDYDGMEYRVVLRVQQRVEQHVLAIGVEITTYAPIVTADNKTPEVTIRCNFECSTRTDFERDLALQNRGWLIHRYTPEEIAEAPMRCAKGAWRVLSAEADRRRAELELQATQKVSRLPN